MCIRDRLITSQLVVLTINNRLNSERRRFMVICDMSSVSYTHLDVYKRQVLLLLAKKTPLLANSESYTTHCLSADETQ